MIWEKVFFNNLSTYISIINNELEKEFPLEPLSNRIKVLGGYAFKANEYRNTGVPVIRISDFNDERIDLSTVKYYKEDKIFDKFQLFPGDIIIAMTGGTIGKLAIVQDGLGKLYLNQRVGKFQILDKSEFESEYVYWLARGIQDKVRNLGYGGAQPNVGNSQIESLQFPFPNRETQIKIIEFLNDLKGNVVKQKVYFNEDVEREVRRVHEVGANLFTLFNEIDQQQSYLQLLRQTILQEAVQGKLTKQDAADEPASELLKRIKAEKQELIKEGKLKKEKELPPISEDEIPFALPKGWVWCRLGEMVDLKSGVTLGKVYKGELIEVPYLRVANVQRGSIDVTHIKTLKVPQSEVEKYRLRKGDLCMIEGGDWDKVGRCAIWTNDIKPCIHQNHIFRLRFYGNISNEWSEMYLNSPIARRYFESFSKQTTNLASINKTQLSSLLFPLPPLSEQQRIVAKVQQLQQQLNALETQVQQSRRYAQQLLQAVLKEAFAVNKNEYATNEQLTMAAEE